MNLEQFRTYCLSLEAAGEDFPFDETTLVFRVGGKIFALTDIEHLPFTISLKCNPERAVELRESYEAITPGWHLNKKHWNSIVPDGSVPESLIKELISHSYELVFASLKKAEKMKIKSSF